MLIIWKKWLSALNAHNLEEVTKYFFLNQFELYM